MNATDKTRKNNSNPALSKVLASSVEITQYIVALGLIILFSFTGMDKILVLSEFQSGLQNSPFIPEWTSWPLAIGATLSFFGISTLLLIGFYKAAAMRMGFWLATGVMLAFTLYMAIIILFAPYRPCICIGLPETLRLNWSSHLLINTALFMVSWTSTLLYYVNKRLVAIGEATPGL